MKDSKLKSSKLKLKSKIPEKQARLIAFIIALPVVFVLLYKVSAFIDENTVSAQQFVDLQQGGEVHAGFRRAHAKGICIKGVFESNGALSEYSSAEIFKSGSYPIVGRFSTAGSNPTAPDLKAPVRSLALLVEARSSQNSEWRMALNTPPVMAVGTPEAFYAQLQALAPDPQTKQSDPSKIKSFFAKHPESQAFLDWKDSYVPANSFAGETYHSINAFYLIDNDQNEQAVRWRALPLLAKEDLPALETTHSDALHQQLSTTLDEGPIKFDLVFTLADINDDETNPTILWPSDRKSISAGTIVVQQYSDQEQGQCANLNFNPLVLPEGVKPTADPILNARSASYTESFRRRAKEVLLGTGQ
jgi:catalase